MGSTVSVYICKAKKPVKRRITRVNDKGRAFYRAFVKGGKLGPEKLMPASAYLATQNGGFLGLLGFMGTMSSSRRLAECQGEPPSIFHAYKVTLGMKRWPTQAEINCTQKANLGFTTSCVVQ